MSTDTTNMLTDFDLCVAVAEAAINTQLTYAWRAWKRRARLDEEIRVFKTVKDGQVVDAKTGLAATVAPLTVSLNVPNARLGQVKVTLSLPTGSVTYVDEEEGTLATYPVTNWSISFITDLDRNPVDLATLATIDPDAMQTAQNVVAASGLPDAVFSIEYLFLKFTEVNLLLADNHDVVIPADVPSAARDRGLSSLNFLLQGQLGNFVLGTVVRRNNEQAAPTFAMTDFIFDVHADPMVGTASTLAYLGVFAGRPLPADRDAARLKLTDAWVRPGQLDGTEASISGTMAISRAAILDRYLIPAFTQLIGRGPTTDAALGWTFSGGTAQNTSTQDIIERQFSWSTNWSLTLRVAPGTNTMSILGYIGSEITYDGYTLGAHWHTEWMRDAGHRVITGSVTFTGSGTGTDFTLTPSVTHTVGDLVVDRADIGGFAQVTDAIEGGFRQIGILGQTDAERLSAAEQGSVNSITTWLDQVLGQVALQMTQHAFIPPGGGVYALSNARFSAAGDVLLDVIYQAP